MQDEQEPNFHTAIINSGNYGSRKRHQSLPLKVKWQEVPTES